MTNDQMSPGDLSGGLVHRPLPVRAVQRLEAISGLDSAVRWLRPVADAVAGPPGRRRLLRGEWMGHAIHPVVVIAPLGLWGSATVLDVVGGPGAASAARRLTLAGLLAVAPAVITGLVEWTSTGPRDSRVGVVHAAVNTVAAVLFAGSYWARGSRRPLGIGLGLAGNAVAGIGGYFGGHLAAARHVGSRHAAFADTP